MLSAPLYAGLIQTNIMAKSYKGHNFNGVMLPVFSLAIATGVVNTSMLLTGQIIGGINAGPTVGVGIMFSGSDVSQSIRDTALEVFKGEGGPVFKDFCDAIGQATQTQFALATLISDTNGSASFPAFSGAASIMAAAIVAAAPQFVGSQWPNVAKVIATGICQTIGSSGSGVLIGAVVPGTGSGIVSIT